MSVRPGSDMYLEKLELFAKRLFVVVVVSQGNSGISGNKVEKW